MNLRRLFLRLTSWTRRAQDEERMTGEFEEHLALLTAENLRAGLSLDEARRQAVLKFGAVQAIRESYREERTLPLIDTLMQDTRYAMRRLRNSPVFTATTVLTLALGIGATTSIFTLVYAVLMKSLAVANPQELLRLGKESRCCFYGGFSQEGGFAIVSYPLYQYFRDHTEGFEQLAAFSASLPEFGIRRKGSAAPAQSLPGEYVSGNYFDMFGIRAYAGRTIVPSDDRPNVPAVAVMSYRLWRERYSSASSVIGSVFDLSGIPYTVVGIAPPEFFGDSLRPNPPDFFLPLSTEALNDGSNLRRPATHWLDLIGRMKPGVNAVSIQAEMRVELKQWLRSHWSEMSANERALLPEQTLFLSPGGAGITYMREQYERWLHVLMMASGFVLIIACANIANLMLVRGMERRRQLSLSMALGARASRIVRQALTESVLLSLFGGTAGLAIAYIATRLILQYVFPVEGAWSGVPIDASPSAAVLLFAFVVSLLTGIAFGMGPAWLATRVDPIEALRGANRSTARTGSSARKALVICQAALALILLSTSGLLTAALHKLENQDFGFDQDNRTVLNFDPRLAGYGPEKLPMLYQRIQDTFSTIPGVSAVALCIYSPLSGNNWNAEIWVDGRPVPGPKDDIDSSWERVSAGYLDVIGNRVIAGRGITKWDTANSENVAVVNQAFARKFFKNENPIGKYFGHADMEDSRDYKIVGITKDARYRDFGLEQPIYPFFVAPVAQHDHFKQPDSIDADISSHYLQNIVVVTKPGATVSFDRLRQALASVDPSLPVVWIHTLKQQVSDVFRQQRLIARLTSLFGVLSLILSCIGLYGVTAYNAGRRTGEIGVRMAMGADRAHVISLVLKGAFAVIMAGLLIGLPLTFVAGRLLGNQLYGVSPYDPVVTAIALVSLGFCALLASLVPAFRASLISPVEALRVE